MEYFVISAKFVPLKYYTLSSQLRRLTSFSVGCSGRRILSPGQIAVMRKWSITLLWFLITPGEICFNPQGFNVGYTWEQSTNIPECPVSAFNFDINLIGRVSLGIVELVNFSRHHDHGSQDLYIIVPS